MDDNRLDNTGNIDSSEPNKNKFSTIIPGGHSGFLDAINMPPGPNTKKRIEEEMRFCAEQKTVALHEGSKDKTGIITCKNCQDNVKMGNSLKIQSTKIPSRLCSLVEALERSK